MTELLLLFLALAGDTAARMDLNGRAAANVASWTFEQTDDTNYDDWPDGWTRWRGEGFPHYVRIAIAAPAESEFAAEGRCLQIELDGGAGASTVRRSSSAPSSVMSWKAACAPGD